MSTKQKLTRYYDLGGTLRYKKPKETLDWLTPLLPKLGITRIANITGLDHINIAVATCMRPNSKHLSVSQGKGASLDLAKISAVMESIEGYHAENPPEIYFTGAYNELKNQHTLISPACFDRAKLSKTNLDALPFSWTKAYDLTTKESCYIPHILTCLNSSKPQPAYACLNVSSNGLAAGNTFDEALCHALYEVVERDALFRWQKITPEERKQTQLDISTIDSPIIKPLIEKILKAKLSLKIWETTSSIQVPAYHCAIDDPNIIRGLGLFTGTGAHLSKDVAISRAVTESVQSRLTLITGNRDDIFPNYYQRFDSDKLAERDFKIEQGVRSYKNCLMPSFKASFAENINQVKKTLAENGYTQILVVNHTKSDLQVPVAQVFINGLQFNGMRM